MSKFSQLYLLFPVSWACSGESMETLKDTGHDEAAGSKRVISP